MTKSNISIFRLKILLIRHYDVIIGFNTTIDNNGDYSVNKVEFGQVTVEVGQAMVEFGQVTVELQQVMVQ